ncbi:MAG TPA: sulfatase-like hydrolase/transferase, partial [Fimbriimonadaceae bacterium]|nr:sulfatase-like hydrolase/transferase [Fimbriimonadaceae bacterium]
MLLEAALLAVTAQTSLPNIVYILADDLGYGEVGCYGQKKIETPNIDRLAAEGMKFTQHYSGAPVCAPARCVLMTGKDSAHAYVRGNKEMGGWGRYDPEGQLPIPASEVTVAEVLKTKGYATGAFGKWGLGGPGSTGHPCFQGFDKFFGYLCQKDAHNYYPTHLWNNHDVHVTDNWYFDAHQKIKDASEGFDQFIGVDYAPDLIMSEAEKWLQANKD